MSKQFLITLTAPSAAGKSYLLNYIRDVAKLPCLISTTTRAKRANEVEGVDYFFITKEQSEVIEARGEFAELAIFGGNRYGVTKTEFASKLNSPEGIAFLIVEPNGIDHYVAPALEVGAEHLKFFIDVPLQIRLDRIKKRTNADILEVVGAYSMDLAFLSVNDPHPKEVDIAAEVNKIVTSYTTRLISVLGPELKWKESQQWDEVLDGQDNPANNLLKILDVVRVAQSISQ